MASVYRQAGKWVVQLSIKGERVRFLGLSKKLADQLAAKLEWLKGCARSGHNPPELFEWCESVAAQNPELFKRLRSSGLGVDVQPPLTLKRLMKLYEDSYDCPATWTRTYNSLRHLIAHFGEEKLAKEITAVEAAEFVRWYKKAPLNRKTSVAKPYSPFKVNRDIGIFKGLFNFALKMGLLTFNPFSAVQGGSSACSENKTYISTEDTLRIINAAGSLKWKTIIALGRFAGCRGACDLKLMTWADVHWSDAESLGRVILRGKTKPGAVPMAPVLENLLRQLFDQAPEGESRVFPSFNAGTSTSVMVGRCFEAAGIVGVPRPWYSLRTSFCNDVLQSGVDLKTYQAVCRHSSRVALESYQQFHDGRLENAAEVLEKTCLMNQRNTENLVANKWQKHEKWQNQGLNNLEIKGNPDRQNETMCRVLPKKRQVGIDDAMRQEIKKWARQVLAGPLFYGVCELLVADKWQLLLEVLGDLDSEI